MTMGCQHIILTPQELESLIERAVVNGVRKAMSPYLSRRQAEREYGRATINNLIEQGLIVGRRQGAAKNAKVVFDRSAIESAING